MAAVVLAGGSMALYQAASFDTFWHLVAGDWILGFGGQGHPGHFGARPTVDTLSYSFRGAAWDNHSPAFQVLLASTVRGLGTSGITWLQTAVAMALAASSIATAHRRHQTSPAAAGLIVVAVFAALAPSLGARPQITAYLFLHLTLHAVLTVAVNPATRWRFALPLIHVAWLFTHGSHVLAPILATGSLALLAVTGRPAAARALLAPAAASWALLIGLDPGAWARVTVHGESAFAMMHLVEWRHVGLPDLLWHPAGAALAAVTALSVAGLAMLAKGRDGSGRRPPELLELTLLGAGVAIAFSTNLRALPTFLLGATPVWLPFAALPFQRAGDALVRLPRAGRAAVAATWVVAIVALVAARGFGGPWLHGGPGVDRDRFPVAAADYLAAHPSEGHVFHGFNEGGYLAWRAVCPGGVLVDSRSRTLYPDRFLLRTTTAMSDPATFDALVETYDIRTALLPTRSARGATLRDALAARPDWRQVHADETATVYVRDPPAAPVSPPARTLDR